MSTKSISLLLLASVSAGLTAYNAVYKLAFFAASGAFGTIMFFGLFLQSIIKRRS